MFYILLLLLSCVGNATLTRALDRAFADPAASWPTIKKLVDIDMRESLDKAKRRLGTREEFFKWLEKHELRAEIDDLYDGDNSYTHTEIQSEQRINQGPHKHALRDFVVRILERWGDAVEEDLKHNYYPKAALRYTSSGDEDPIADLKASLFKKFRGSLGASLAHYHSCLLYTSPSPRDRTRSRMPSSA